MKKTASIVKGVREKLGLTQTELAAKLGVVSTTVSRYECGALVPSKTVLLLLKSLNKGGK